MQALVIVWNYKEGTIEGSHETHKVSVEDLCFTCNSDFLVSLGGRDDGNVIVWDVRKSSAICGIFPSNFLFISHDHADLHENFQRDDIRKNVKYFPQNLSPAVANSTCKH